MLIHVRLAEPFWRPVGQRNLDLEMESGAQVSDLMTLLCQQYPALDQELKEAPPLIFIDDDEVELETALRDGGRVHLVWAIAGG